MTASCTADLADSPARRSVRRSALIMPVNVPAFVEKAHLRGADAIVLDLEDSIPPAEKARARTLVKGAIPLVARGGADVLVRINRPWELGEEDLEAAVWPGLSGVAVPKAEQAEELQRVDEALGRLERSRGIPPGTLTISISIESVAALFNARALATASPRLFSIHQGSEDFALDLGIEPTPEGTELLYGKLLVVLLARDTGLYAMGTMRGTADYRDLDGLRRAAQEAKAIGYRGSSCIHPAQVTVLNEVFQPTPAEVDHARRVIAVYEEAEAQGRASVGLEGKMIDIPVVARARRVVARAEQIAAFEARKRAALAAAGE